jgi:hypothetical protein
MNTDKHKSEPEAPLVADSLARRLLLAGEEPPLIRRNRIALFDNNTMGHPKHTLSEEQCLALAVDQMPVIPGIAKWATKEFLHFAHWHGIGDLFPCGLRKTRRIHSPVVCKMIPNRCDHEQQHPTHENDRIYESPRNHACNSSLYRHRCLLVVHPNPQLKK